MQHVENDMDELFRKAAENYPLKTTDNEWEAIASRIKGNLPVAQKPVKSSANWKKYLFAALFLLMTLLLTDIIIRTRGDEKTITGNNEKAILKNDFESNQETSVSKNEINNNFLNPFEIVTDKNHITNNSKNDFLIRDIKNSNDSSYSLEFNIYSPSIAKNRNENFLTTIGDDQPGTIKTPELYSFLLKQRNSPSVIVPEVTSNVGRKDEKGFYWGVLAGLQFSEVKDQGLTKTGFDAGIPVGFRVNKNISIESGLFYSTKYYYSEGKHFIMKKPDPTMPVNMIIMDLKGRNSVIELPVKLKFDFVNNHKNKFFGTAGISSYILTKEKNIYHTILNGSESYVTRSYKNNSNYTAASLNFSMGIEHRLPNQKAIRIEPYLQIPLKGIGIGSMHVTSAGIHVGIMNGNRRR